MKKDVMLFDGKHYLGWSAMMKDWHPLTAFCSPEIRSNPQHLGGCGSVVAAVRGGRICSLGARGGSFRVPREFIQVHCFYFCPSSDPPSLVVNGEVDFSFGVEAQISLFKVKKKKKEIHYVNTLKQNKSIQPRKYYFFFFFFLFLAFVMLLTNILCLTFLIAFYFELTAWLA